ncbi:cell division protein SepF [Dethiothermospora halolimnae]|uniref:cell division protein SepF n=1 Tax=Dethiothermospora halolimnae TaxID=3114390 RepID=UPI003CCB9DC5
MGNSANKLFDKFKYIIGIDDLDDEYIEEEEEQEEDMEKPLNFHSPSKLNNKVVNIHTNKNIKMSIHQPTKYDEAPSVVDDLKVKKPVVINLGELDSDIKRQVFDFINGALYSLEGNIQKVDKDIFILAPENVEIDSKIKQEIKSKGLFSWYK